MYGWCRILLIHRWGGLTFPPGLSFGFCGFTGALRPLRLDVVVAAVVIAVVVVAVIVVAIVVVVVAVVVVVVVVVSS